METDLSLFLHIQRLTKLTSRIKDIQPFHVMKILARARELEAQGHDVVHMEIGEPDFSSPEPIIRAGIEAMWGAFNNQDVEGFIAGAAEDVNVSFDGAPTFTSRNDFRDYAKGFFDWTSDAKVSVETVLVNGDEASAELRMVGTHDREPLYGVEAAGTQGQAISDAVSPEQSRPARAIAGRSSWVGRGAETDG